MKVAATLNVNGIAYPVEIDPHAACSRCATVLGLTGTKEGCDDSECGACMMLLDGDPVNSCSYLALQAEGREIITVEGLARRGAAPLQRLPEQGGVQCGFCTPGMLISATALLVEHRPRARKRSGSAWRQPLPLHRLRRHRQSRPLRRRRRGRRRVMRFSFLRELGLSGVTARARVS